MAEPTQLSSAAPPAASSLSTPPQPPLPRLGNPPTLREEGGDALILAGIAHDARNLVTALGLCAELIGEPGVLAPHHRHFAAQIRSVASSSAQLVERLSGLLRKTAQPKPGATAASEAPIGDLAGAVQKLRSLLSAIAGPVTEVQFACLPCPGLLRLTEESLSRILINLVRNAADAMPTGGRVRITTQRADGASFLWALGDSEDNKEYLWDDAPHSSGANSGSVLLTVEDTGPGIQTDFLERVFEAGFSTRRGNRSWPEMKHHGLGLSIVRQLVEEAGGTVRAGNSPLQGARFEIELPLTNVTPSLPLEPTSRDKNGLQ